jgi:hypothetical protein
MTRILARVIDDRTHTARGSRMGAATAAISPLGLDLDLIEHRSWCACAVAHDVRRRCCASMAGADDGTDARARKVTA